MPLFQTYAKQGFRVVAFDLPSHGENSGIGNSINFYTFDELAQLANEIEHFTRSSSDSARPFFVSGWSTGGLVVTRMLQEADMTFDRKVQGAVLFAPGVAVHTLVGKHGVVTQETLTSNPNPPHRGPIAPSSPLKTPIFAALLLKNSVQSQFCSFLDKSIPMLWFVAGNDKYVVTDKLVSFVKDRKKQGVNMTGMFCEKSLHELDNEVEPIASDVRNASAQFFSWVLQNEGASVAKFSFASTACKAI